MTRPLNVAVAGYGAAGELHARLLAARPRLRIAAIADLTRSRRSVAAAAYPDAVVAAELHGLDMRIDLVVVATPPASHESDTLVALTRHRAHVLCEKPAVLDPVRGRRLAVQATAARLLLHPVHNYLYASAFDHMERLIKHGAVGQVESVAIDISRTAAATGNDDWMPTWRTDPALGGGILRDHGPHAIYLVCHLAGGFASRVACTTVTGRRGADHAAAVHLEMTGGARTSITLTWQGAHRGNRYEVVGTEGRLILQGGRLRLSSRDRAEHWPAEDPASGGHNHAHWLRALHTDLLARIDESAPASDPWSLAIHVAEVIRAADASAARGGSPVRLDEAAGPTKRTAGPTQSPV